MKLAHWTTSIAGTVLAFTVTAVSAALSTDDVTFNGNASDAFYGPASIGSQSPDAIENFANDITISGKGKNQIVIQGDDPLWGGGWSFLLRDDKDSGSVFANYSGFSFTLAAANNQNGQPDPAAWTLTVADLTPNSGLSIPFEMDFLVYMHGGNNGAYYFFDDREISAYNAGTFQITFKNGGGNFPGLSGLSLLVRDLRDIPTTQPPAEVDIPEPASMLLFGAGLLGLGLSRRRKLA